MDIFYLLNIQNMNCKKLFKTLLFIITAFYIAAKATHSIIIASTQIYGGKQRNFVRTRIKAIIMLIILIFLVLSIVGILSVGSRIVNYITEVNGIR